MLGSNYVWISQRARADPCRCRARCGTLAPPRVLKIVHGVLISIDFDLAKSTWLAAAGHFPRGELDRYTVLPLHQEVAHLVTQVDNKATSPFERLFLFYALGCSIVERLHFPAVMPRPAQLPTMGAQRRPLHGLRGG